MYSKKATYLPKAILDSIPDSVHDMNTRFVIERAYKELKRGKNAGLFSYKIGKDGVSVNADNYDSNLVTFYEKCEVVNSCSSNLIRMDMVPKRPRDIAAALHRALAIIGLRYDEITLTVKAVTGYKRVITFTETEKATHSLIQALRTAQK